MDAEALYLYGVVSADALPTVTIAGVSSRGPVETIAHGALAAMVSRVPINEFGDENLKQNVERMDWLERTARGHEAVVENISAQTTVIPMRICTLFRSADSVREMLTREAEPLANALAGWPVAKNGGSRRWLTWRASGERSRPARPLPPDLSNHDRPCLHRRPTGRPSRRSRD